MLATMHSFLLVLCCFKFKPIRRETESQKTGLDWGGLSWHDLFVDSCFYGAMHCSAKRGLAIACRPSVCPSVRLSMTLVDQDHIGWKAWKLIARTVSPTPSLFAAQTPYTYSHGNMGKFWETRGGVKKRRSGAQKRNISETRKDRGKFTMKGL